MSETEKQLWLEVSKVRLEDEGVFVQVKGDKSDRPEWWKVEGPVSSSGNGQAVYDRIATGLDREQQTVIARLAPDGGTGICCTSLRFQTR